MKFGIIGNDQMVLSCIQLLQQRPDAEISFVIYDLRRLNPMNSIDTFCKTHNIEAKGITRLNSPEILSFIQSKAPDYILSINNFWVIRENVLAIPGKGSINFHNSVPSRYHGLNIPSWVIINGEKTHGAMWHFVEPGIDTGDVIIYDEFELTKNETAASLMVKCIKKGIEMFATVLDKLFNDNITRSPQVPNASYFGKHDYPANKGYIDFNDSMVNIERLVRGLNYHPFANTYLYAKIANNEKELIVNAVTAIPVEYKTTAGKIVYTKDGSFAVECKDGLIEIEDAMDAEYNGYEEGEIGEFLGIKEGAFL